MGRVIAGEHCNKTCDGYTIQTGVFKRLELSRQTVAAVQWIDRSQFIALVRFRDNTESMLQLERKEWPNFLGRMYGVPEYKRGEEMPRVDTYTDLGTPMIGQKKKGWWTRQPLWLKIVIIFFVLAALFGTKR